MDLEGGGVLVLPWMVAAIGFEPFELGGEVTRLGQVSTGFRLGQFLTVFGDVGFDGLHTQNRNLRHLTR